MFKITQKSSIAVAVAAAAGALVAVAGSFVVSGKASVVNANTPLLSANTPLVGANTPVVSAPVVNSNASVAVVTPVQRPVASYQGPAALDDMGVLTVDVNQVFGSRGAQALLVGREARLLTGPATRIASVQGGLFARALLDQAIVRVRGQLLPVTAWAWNDQGERVPTIRVSQILVLQAQVQDTTSTDASNQG